MASPKRLPYFIFLKSIQLCKYIKVLLINWMDSVIAPIGIIAIIGNEGGLKGVGSI